MIDQHRSRAIMSCVSLALMDLTMDSHPIMMGRCSVPGLRLHLGQSVVHLLGTGTQYSQTTLTIVTLLPCVTSLMNILFYERWGNKPHEICSGGYPNDEWLSCKWYALVMRRNIIMFMTFNCRGVDSRCWRLQDILDMKSKKILKGHHEAVSGCSKVSSIFHFLCKNSVIQVDGSSAVWEVYLVNRLTDSGTYMCHFLN